jgi:hypothetical protein
MGLNLFPVRVPIGKAIDASGKTLDVLMTPEFSRALSDLFVRVGGETGSSSDDIETLAAEGLVPTPAAPAADQQPDTPPEVAALMNELVQLRQQMQALQQQFEQFTQPAPSSNADLEELIFSMSSFYTGVDWGRPGKIGLYSANSGAFTTLTASGAVALSPANANVVLAPTGTGVVTINPATLGSMNKVAIGATTAASGRFTTVDTTNSAGGAASVAYRLFDATGNYSFGMGPTSTEGFINYNSGTASSAIFGHRWNVNGIEVAKVDGTGLFSAASLKSVGAFGCNGKAAQTAAASGGAVAGTGATNAAPYGYTTAAQADAIVSRLNTMQAALVANGILS